MNTVAFTRFGYRSADVDRTMSRGKIVGLEVALLVDGPSICRSGTYENCKARPSELEDTFKYHESRNSSHV